MNLEQVLSSLKAGGLHPVRVETISPIDELPELIMRGTLEEFIEAARALEEKVVFVNVLKLEETDFLYIIGSGGDEPDWDEIDPETDIVDLAEISPELSDYLKYLGTDYMFIISVYFKVHSLTYHIAEDWWPSFQSARARVAQEVEEQREDEMEVNPKRRKRGRNGRSGKHRPN